MSNREAYQQQMEAKMKEWGAKLEELKAKAEGVQAEAKIQLKEEIHTLSAKREAVEEKLHPITRSRRGCLGGPQNWSGKCVG